MKSLNTSIDELRATVLDMRTDEPTRGNREHNLDKLDKIADDLEKNSDGIETFVTGHGTGDD